MQPFRKENDPNQTSKKSCSSRSSSGVYMGVVSTASSPCTTSDGTGTTICFLFPGGFSHRARAGKSEVPTVPITPPKEAEIRFPGREKVGKVDTVDPGITPTVG